MKCDKCEKDSGILDESRRTHYKFLCSECYRLEGLKMSKVWIRTLCVGCGIRLDVRKADIKSGKRNPTNCRCMKCATHKRWSDGAYKNRPKPTRRYR